MKCYYHKSDLDGVCSAAIIHNEFNRCELIGVDYLTEIKIPYLEQVFIVDFSFPEDIMVKVNEKNDMIWIDHHVSAIKKLWKYKFKGLQKVDVGACSLTSDYLMLQKNYPVTLLSDFDIGKYKNNDVIPFQYGLLARNLSPESPIFTRLLSNSIDSIELTKSFIAEGKKFLEYEASKNKKILEFAGDVIIHFGDEYYKCLSLNTIIGNSLIFKDIKGYDVYHKFYYDIKNNKIKNTLYSDTIKVNRIAEEYGGGGHSNVAGFYSDKYPFKNSPYYSNDILKR